MIGDHMPYFVRAFGNVITNTGSWKFIKTSAILRLSLNSKLPVAGKLYLEAMSDTEIGHMTYMAGLSLLFQIRDGLYLFLEIY